MRPVDPVAERDEEDSMAKRTKNPKVLAEKVHLVPCTGEAHGNPYIDNCMMCAPHWGWVEVPVRFATLDAYREWYYTASEQLSPTRVCQDGRGRLYRVTMTCEGGYSEGFGATLAEARKNCSRFYRNSMGRKAPRATIVERWEPTEEGGRGQYVPCETATNAENDEACEAQEEREREARIAARGQ
jgi:hypothetical protein